jgi:saccharopine dehydrogenase-like NADP-dependent oxidoreductase
MSKEVAEKIRVLIEFGFNSRDPVKVNGQTVVPRDLMVSLLILYVPPITSFLAPPSRRPPDWAKEIVTEVHGVKDRREMTYRLETLTCKGALPIGLVPAIVGI